MKELRFNRCIISNNGLFAECMERQFIQRSIFVPIYQAAF